MQCAVSREKKLELIIMGTQGHKQKDIAIALDISVSTVQRTKQKNRHYGE